MNDEERPVVDAEIVDDEVVESVTEPAGEGEQASFAEQTPASNAEQSDAAESLQKRRESEVVAAISKDSDSEEKVPLRKDLIILTKLRLNVFVLITTFFGFLLATDTLNASWNGERIWLLVHALLGTACAAFGSAVFNQLMEIDQDRRMRRTADRPLPARRMMPTVAFAIGWSLAAFGIIHLSAKVNASSAYLAAVTIGIYVFVYTPMKRTSSLNTLVGAIPGAIPPMIGWAAAGGGIFSVGSWLLFALLFLWQLPHFIAISWLCREEYEEAGYKMWSNGDVNGARSAWLALFFAIGLAAVGLLPWVFGLASMWAAIVTAVLALGTAWLAIVFRAKKDRPAARKLFFSTLIYLPIALAVLAIGWD